MSLLCCRRYCVQLWGSSPLSTYNYYSAPQRKIVRIGNKKTGKNNKCGNRKDIGVGFCYYSHTRWFADVYKCFY